MNKKIIRFLASLLPIHIKKEFATTADIVPIFGEAEVTNDTAKFSFIPTLDDYYICKIKTSYKLA